MRPKYYRHFDRCRDCTRKRNPSFLNNDNNVINKYLNVTKYDSIYLKTSNYIHHDQSHNHDTKVFHYNSCPYDQNHELSDVGADAHYHDDPCKLHIGGHPAIPGQRLDQPSSLLMLVYFEEM